MKLTFWGAARQVTGSMHLLETETYRILIDTGLETEKSTYQEDNEHFPFDPSCIDVVILTHAHIDHSGNLPTLVRKGFKGQILCTAATAALSELLLMDSVRLFLKKYHRKGRKKMRVGPRPLYLEKEVEETLERMVPIGFNQAFQLTGSIQLTFIPVAHLLGAAAVILKITENGHTKSIGFSGDVGRKTDPLLPAPLALPPVDYLVCESTYGGRLHSEGQSISAFLTEVIQNACLKTPGRLIIPAFSIGRTQALLYLLSRLFSERALPPLRVFVDSPLAAQASAVYDKFQYLFKEEAQQFFKQQGFTYSSNIQFTTSAEDSLYARQYLDPCIVISSAGMLEGGRIQDHLYFHLQNFYCSILFIGYCAKGTLGDRLMRGDPIVRLRNRDLMVYATILKTDLFSGHADHQGLLDTIIQIPDLKQVFLVHGENSSCESLGKSLLEKGVSVCIPEKGSFYEL